jgi:hypothetical protein
MNVFNLRSGIASLLSLWLGVLACLLGCAQPTSAAPERGTSTADAVSCPASDSAADDSCCQHGHNPTNPETNRHHAKSCCPTETVVIQKQTVTTPELTHVIVATLALLNVDASKLGFASISLGDFVPWQASGDILRQVHVLRI